MITSTHNRVTTGKLLVIVFLLAAIAASLMLGLRPSYASTTFTVTNTNDSDAGSLRQAITNANNTAGTDVINFNIPGSDVHTISPLSALPEITEAVTINGYSQPGAHPNTKAVGNDAVLKIELSGTGTQYGYGLVIEASNSTVKGLVINRWSDAGVYINGTGATGNKVVGNFIGTDDSGTQKLGNYTGIRLYEGSNNTIGGTTPAERNVISGNNSTGVEISGSGGNKVMGNYVGTARNGTTPLGNTDQGVFIGRSANNTVGGTIVGARNVISANDDGVLIFDASGNKIMGNYVGTDASGTKDLGNNSDGVNVSEATNTIVGGSKAGARNVISGNRRHGVEIYGSTSTGIRILSNSIYANVGVGIDLGTDGLTPNDPGDTDAGPNGLQNKPLLSSARKSATGTTTVRGTLNSTPETTFNIQFFSNPSGTNEGKTFLFSESVRTNGTGNASFTFSTKKTIRLGQNITATATNTSTGNTSEFSGPRKVVAQ